MAITSPPTGYRIYAHRGSTVLAPENTQVSFDLALSLGSHVLETDVRLDRDAQVIVIHDDTVDRTTDGTGRVADLSLHELRQLDAGYRMTTEQGESFAGKGICLMSLNELFEQYPDTPINIDIKDKSLLAAHQVARAIEHHNRGSLTTTGSFHATVIRHFRRLAPGLRTAACMQDVARLYFSSQRQLKSAGNLSFQAVQIPTSWGFIPLGTQAFIDKAHALGFELCYWTINEPEHMRRLVERGARCLVTDRPDVARAVFEAMDVPRSDDGRV